MTRLPKLLSALATMLILLSLSACQSETESEADYRELQSPAPAAASFAGSSQRSMDAVNAQKARNPYLAFEHYYRIRLPQERIRERFEATVDQCTQGDFHGCILLEASLNEDRDYVNASIQMRIKTEGVEPLIDTAAQGGEVASQTSRAEDLTEAVTDTEKRLEMLINYRDRLQALENQAAEDIEALIQVNSELARVQSDIEFAQGTRENLQRRLDLDLLNINFYAQVEDSTVGPIQRALENFLDNLAAGVSGIINTIAVGLPWLIGLALLFFLLRWIWRSRRRKRF